MTDVEKHESMILCGKSDGKHERSRSEEARLLKCAENKITIRHPHDDHRNVGPIRR